MNEAPKATWIQWRLQSDIQSGRRPRILILGGSKTGKTQLANSLGGDPGLTLFRTDDLIGTHDWSAASLAAAAWMESAPPPWIAEGVALARSIRKFLGVHPDRRPADLVIRCVRPWIPLTVGQVAMNKGEQKVWDEVVPHLRRLGVELRTPEGEPL